MSERKFLVLVREVHVSVRKVEATSADEAVDKVRRDGDWMYVEYSHTLDPATWTVEEVDDG
jgi:hypothetical protein